MLRGGNMRFRPAIFFWFVFTQSFFKLHKNGDNRKLKAFSFRLWKNDFCRLYNKRARALQIWITFFLYTLYTKLKPWSKEAQVIANFNMSWLVKLVIKRSASSREDLKIVMPFARVRVILQCWNIKLVKTRDYWTGDYVFHGNWSRKICLSLYFLSKRTVIVRKSTQANASHCKLLVKRGTSRHKLKLAMTCVFVWSGLYMWCFQKFKIVNRRPATMEGSVRAICRNPPYHYSPWEETGVPGGCME